MATHRAHSHLRRGATAVEFAIAAPILFLFIFASIEFSRANMIRNTVDNAAFEGARRGIVPGATAEQAEAAAQEVLATIGVHDAIIDVSPTLITSETIDVTVHVRVSLDNNTFAVRVFFGGHVIEGTSTLRCEESLSRISN